MSTGDTGSDAVLEALDALALGLEQNMLRITMATARIARLRQQRREG